MTKSVLFAALVILLLYIAAWIALGIPSVYSIRNAININSNKQDCQKYVHYENGQQVYEYYKCIPVTPEVNN